MSGVKVADVVPNAIELRPLVTDSPYGSKIAGDRDRADTKAADETGAGHRPVIAPDATNVGHPAVRR
jgi:hypothetical protein